MEINTHNNHKEKMQRCEDYMQALEQERCKILVFQRELPLCLELVTQAIESCKQQLSGTITTTECNLQNRQLSGGCSEQTSSDAPVLEEFIPIIKRASSSLSDCEEEQDSKKAKIDDETNFCDTEGQNGDNTVKKSDWLRSVQLWNQSPDPPSKEDDSPKKVEVKKSGSGGAFHPFKKDENVAPPVEDPVAPVSTSSTGTGGGGGGNKKEEKDGQSRKTRRCWSPELHRRFLQALNQLGGSHLATPKQIRELMKVDGLTNDEVKSHLQKYRLHTRRPSPSNQNTTNAQAPQFVVVTGGLWMPPEYTATMATTAATSGDAASNGIYAPVASLPPPFRETSASPKKTQHKTLNFNDRDSHSERGVRSISPATSSSTHTMTVY
ncbi:transcription factor pcl1 [Phtheirospermum japonicum]|uniref:Transcription factor pcl1 n=1 Tax=Phtheirospermum japonicum TaxID=374723 RepID=A0A830CE64_9LAMI|nr:transcription factor pcl1 [Phtheirospermum japonicum]